MTKTPEQMAEEYAAIRSVADESVVLGANPWTKAAFLAGYEAAKEQLADASKVMDTCEHILDMEKMVDVNSLEKPDGWISVKERLPNIGAPCLVTCHEERYTIAEYDGIKWTTLNSIAYYHPIVTHWQPLPEAPKGEK